VLGKDLLTDASWLNYKKEKEKAFLGFSEKSEASTKLILGTCITDQGYLEQKEYLHIFHESLVTISSPSTGNSSG
jgi:hypothetical protein